MRVAGAGHGAVAQGDISDRQHPARHSVADVSFQGDLREVRRFESKRPPTPIRDEDTPLESGILRAAGEVRADSRGTREGTRAFQPGRQHSEVQVVRLEAHLQVPSEPDRSDNRGRGIGLHHADIHSDRAASALLGGHREVSGNVVERASLICQVVEYDVHLPFGILIGPGERRLRLQNPLEWPRMEVYRFSNWLLVPK